MNTTDKHNIYDDAVAYDVTNGGNTDDLSFFLNSLPAGSKHVLELGCGTGRLAIPLALQGFDVTGIDIEDTMLTYAREKAMQKGVKIDWIHGDVSDFDLGKQFDVILFPANSIAHLLDNQSMEACLGCIRKHLDNEGRFIFQAFNPILQILTRNPEQRFPVSEYDDPMGGGHVIITEQNKYDLASQINNITWHYLFQNTGEKITKTLPLRMFFPQELDSLLRHNGFDIVAKYGGFDGGPFTSESTSQILVCSKHIRQENNDVYTQTYR